MCFGADLMHLISLNLTDLLLGLWQGTIQHDPLDKDVWDWARDYHGEKICTE